MHALVFILWRKSHSLLDDPRILETKDSLTFIMIYNEGFYKPSMDPLPDLGLHQMDFFSHFSPYSYWPNSLYTYTRICWIWTHELSHEILVLRVYATKGSGEPAQLWQPSLLTFTQYRSWDVSLRVGHQTQSQCL